MIMMMMMMMMHPLCNILVQDLTLGAPHGQAPVGGVQTILLKHYYLQISVVIYIISNIVSTIYSPCAEPAAQTWEG